MLFTPARRHSGFDLFDDFFNDPFFSTSVSQPANSLMRTDVRDDGTNYLLDIELPGFKKEDIQAELKNGYLTIAASQEDNKEEKDANGKILPGTLQRFLQKKLLCGRPTQAGRYPGQLRERGIKTSVPQRNSEGRRGSPQIYPDQRLTRLTMDIHKKSAPVSRCGFFLLP